jgi:uncharacterized repeat protein (TIGR01451 family)
MLRWLLCYLALTGLVQAQVVFTLNGPASVSDCDRLALTNICMNAGATLSHLTITQSLPSASYVYAPGQSLVLLNGTPVSAGAAADPATNGNLLVWDLTNLVATANTDHLLISEVYYNTGGTTPDLTKQWLELYNPTPNSIALAGWSIKDALPGQISALPATNMAPFSFLIVAASANAFRTAYPSYSGSVAEVTNGALGKGLNYFASGVSLLNPASNVVDAVSFGGSTAAFSPPCATVSAGHSLARNPTDQDGNTRSDWIDKDTPNPGTGYLPLGVPNGGIVKVIFQMDVRCGAASGEFVASAAFQQPDGGTTNVATAATFVTLLPGSLTVTKTPSLQSAGVGDSAVWTITVRNEGFGRAVNVAISDKLGSGLSFTGFSASPTNAAPFSTNAITWDATTVPALSNLAAGAQVSIVVTAIVNECMGLWNQADTRWGCSASETCQDTAPGQTALAGINFIRRTPSLTGGLSPTGTVSIDYCAGSPVTIALTNAIGAGPARNIRFQPLLPTGFEVAGPSVSNGWIVVGNLAGGQTMPIRLLANTTKMR